MKIRKVKNKKLLKELKTVPELFLSFRKTPIEKKMLDNTEKIVDFLRKVFSKDSFLIQEEVILVLLNGNCMPLGFLRLAKGGQEEVTYDSKKIVQAVLISGASSFVIAHNHPDDICFPSDQDIRSIYALRQMTKIFKINYLDDIILTHDNFYSCKDEELVFDLG